MQVIGQVAVGGMLGAGAGDNHNIQSGQFVLMPSEGFAHQTLESVAGDGLLHLALGNGQPETGVRQSIASIERAQMGSELAGRVREQSLVIGRL